MAKKDPWATWAFAISTLSLIVSIAIPFFPRVFNLKHEADTELVTAGIDGDSRGEPSFQAVVRNVGDQVAVVTKAVYELDKVWTFQTPECEKPQLTVSRPDVLFQTNRILKFGATRLKVTLPTSLVVEGSQAQVLEASVGDLSMPPNTTTVAQMRVTFEQKPGDPIPAGPFLFVLGGDSTPYFMRSFPILNLNPCPSTAEVQAADKHNLAVLDDFNGSSQGARTSYLSLFVSGLEGRRN